MRKIKMPDSITDIREWLPKKDDTLQPETHKKMCDMWKSRVESKYGVSTNTLYTLIYGYNGTREEYDHKTGDVTKVPVFNNQHYGCLGMYNAGASKDTDGLLWMTTCQMNPEQTQDYFNWIFNLETSPWRDITKHCTIIRNPKTKFVEGMLWTNVDTPSRLFASLMIALKIGTGMCKYPVWNSWVKHGLDPALAVAILANYNYCQRYNTSLGNKNWWDLLKDQTFEKYYTIHPSAVNGGSETFGTEGGEWGTFNPAAFMAGKYEDKTRVMKGHRPQPCNRIWNTAGKPIWIRSNKASPFELGESNNLEKGAIKIDPWKLSLAWHDRPDKDMIAEINKRGKNNTPIYWGDATR